MKLYINIDAIVENAKILKERLSKQNIEFVPVTKGLMSPPELLYRLKKEGFKLFAESRIENVKKFNKEVDFMFLRPPANSEIEDVVEYCKYSIQSSLFTMKHMQNLITKTKSEHKMLLMIDMGDLRDGIYYKDKEIFDDILSSIDNNLIVGIATNLGCFGGVIPDEKIMKRFTEIAQYLISKNKNIKIISGGNTTTLPLTEEGNMENLVNQFRVGEAMLLGTDITRNKKVEYLSQNTMFLEAQLIEVYEKWLQDDDIEFGYDAFGRKKEDSGREKLKRGIVYMGEIDVATELTYPIDEDVRIIGSSSDQTVLDLTKSHNNYKIGDTLRFKIGYGSMVKAITSPFVKKIYI